LTDTTFTTTREPAQTLALAELDSVSELDGNVCIWKRGMEHAIAKVPASSPNAFLLQLILGHRLAERDKTSRPDSSDGLGRVLFERRASRVGMFILWVLTISLAFFGLFLIVAGIGGGNPAPIGVGVGLSALFALCAWIALRMRRSVFRCHEQGVYRRSTFTEGTLRYDELSQFTYSATRQYYNGVYVGTALNLTLTPERETGKRAIRFNSNVKNVDEALDKLRDHIAAMLAARMLQRLAAGERVTWTTNLALLPEGIEYRPAGFVGRRKEALVLQYADVYSFDIQKGTFHLWQRGKEKKSVMQESIGQPNFFPGFMALCQLFSSPERAASDLKNQ
jgi:hypothetical protein